MRVVVHDYAGHPFQVQLSRALAGRGHEVMHAYAASVQTPRGSLERRTGDPPGLALRPIALTETVAKYSFVRRRRQEIRYGRLAADIIGTFEPDVVVSANTPPDVQRAIQDRCRRMGARFVFWLQDVFGVGIERVLRRKLPVLGRPIARHYQRLESRLLDRSDEVVLITEDFASVLPKTLDGDRVHVIPNWAPLDELPPGEKDNDWSRRHGLAETFNFVYSGTLGLKHDPSLLLRLAERFQDRGDVRVVVVSEGAGADWLKARQEEDGAGNLILLPFQPFEEMPAVLATGDVLVAILEADAGLFSVPSKVLTYLCARRPLLLAVPHSNLAARIVRSDNAGIVTEPGDEAAFVEAGERLYAAADLRSRLAVNGRAYAERHFDIRRIADRFESILANNDHTPTKGRD